LQSLGHSRDKGLLIHKYQGGMMWNLEEVCEDVQEFVPKHDVRKQFHLLDVPPLSLALLGVASCEILPENGTVTQFEGGHCVIVVHSCSKFLWMACKF